MTSFLKDNESSLIVFGSTGFIGRHLIKTFQKNNNIQKLVGYNSSNANLLGNDVVDRLRRELTAKDTLLILSANTKQSGATMNEFRANMNMITNLCDLIKLVRPKKVIYFSTQAIFGEDTNHEDIEEITEPVPSSIYGLSKLTSERLLDQIIKPLSTTQVILRIPRVYGPEDSISNYGPSQFLHLSRQKKCINLWGDGLELRHFLFVEDLTNAVIEILNRPELEGILNLAPDQPSTFLEAADLANELTQSQEPLVYLERTRPKANHVMNLSRWREKIPDFSFTSLREGMMRTLDYQTTKKESNYSGIE